MGYDGHWNFYQVSDKMFPAINFEFASAQKGIKIIFDKRSCFELPEETAKNDVFTLCDNKREVFFHTPFANLDYQVSHQDNWQLPHLKQSFQSRTLPTSILFYGIGRERFFQLPGRLGNMLIHSSDIELKMFKVSQILNFGSWVEE